MDSVYLEISFKYVHFASIFAIIGAVVSEHLLLKREMSRREIKKLSQIDAVYGLAAILLLIAGFTLWFGVGKPAVYYSSNWVFLLKLGLFTVVGLLSIYPTIFFRKQGKGDLDEVVVIPSSVKLMIRLEIALLFIIPFLASMMAKGLG